jgi:hypothetical protein
MKTGSSPMRPVRASGKASAAKAMKCTSLSLPSGAGCRTQVEAVAWRNTRLR